MIAIYNAGTLKCSLYRIADVHTVEEYESVALRRREFDAEGVVLTSGEWRVPGPPVTRKTV